MMISVDDVLSAFGGSKSFGDLLGLSSQAVWNMKARGSIPVTYWEKLLSEAKTREGRSDVTPDQAEILRSLSWEAFNAMRAAQRMKAG